MINLLQIIKYTVLQTISTVITQISLLMTYLDIIGRHVLRQRPNKGLLTNLPAGDNIE